MYIWGFVCREKFSEDEVIIDFVIIFCIWKKVSLVYNFLYFEYILRDIYIYVCGIDIFVFILRI